MSYLSYFRPTKFKTHYVAPQFFIFRQTVQIAPKFLHWNAHIFLFWLNPTGHSKFHNTSNTPPATDSCQTGCTPLYPEVQAIPSLTPSIPPPLFFLVPDRGTCACDRRALQQLVLNLHVKNTLIWSDLSWSVRLYYHFTRVVSPKVNLHPKPDHFAQVFLVLSSSLSSYYTHYPTHTHLPINTHTHTHIHSPIRHLYIVIVKIQIKHYSCHIRISK